MGDWVAQNPPTLCGRAPKGSERLPLTRKQEPPPAHLCFPTRRLAPARQPAGVRRWSGTAGVFPSSERFAARGCGGSRARFSATTVLGGSGRHSSVPLRAPVCPCVLGRGAGGAQVLPACSCVLSCNPQATLIPFKSLRSAVRSDARQTWCGHGALRLVGARKRPRREDRSSVYRFAARVRARPAKAVLPRRARSHVTVWRTSLDFFTGRWHVATSHYCRGQVQPKSHLHRRRGWHCSHCYWCSSRSPRRLWSFDH